MTIQFYPIIGATTPQGVANEWGITRTSNLKFGISSAGCTKIINTTSDSEYIVLQGTPNDFLKIREGRPLSVGESAGLILSTQGTRDGSIRVEVNLLEYGQDGRRLGVTIIGLNSTSLIRFKPEVHFVLPSIRFQGQGQVELSNLELKLVPVSESTSVGTHTYDYFDDIQSNLKPMESIDTIVRAATQLKKRLSALKDNPAHVVGEVDNLKGLETSQYQSREFLLELADTLPQSNGSVFDSDKLPFRVGIITDEYMYNYYTGVFEELHYISPDDIEYIDSLDHDLLLYVTGWKGLRNDEWQGHTYKIELLEKLKVITDSFKARGKPTIFQSIEDPSNFDRFIDIARMFDHVFTSDADIVDKYKQELSHHSIHYGQYGVNALLNNPIGSTRHYLNRGFFAGSYPKRYAERCHDMEIIFDSIINSGGKLTIADRNFGNAEFSYPGKYHSFTIPSIPHELLQRVHKLFRYNLNFNSIKHSSTMCAMRVYELQATGRPLISNYSRSILEQFPEIRMVAAEESLKYTFSDQIGWEELRRSNDAVHKILDTSTSNQVTRRMLALCGLLNSEIEVKKQITVIIDSQDDKAIEFAKGQKGVDVNIVLLDESRNIDEIIDGIRHDKFITFMAGTFSYSPNYLSRAVNAFRFVDVDYVTHIPIEDKDVDPSSVRYHEYYEGEHNKFTTLYHVAGEVGKIRSVILGKVQGMSGYVNAPFDVENVQVDISYLSGRTDASVDRGYKLAIIVPVFNNGRYLRDMCLPSLMRNDCWPDMQVILVDDGSTDSSTRKIAMTIAEQHENVVLHLCDVGGSGSASRPRNIGLSYVEAPVLAYLDPDNTISERGYDDLLELFDEASATHPDISMISGYQVKIGKRSAITGRHVSKRLHVIENVRNAYFGSGKFPVISTQAALIRADFLRANNISYVEGAAGQDTLFGWEIVAASKSIAFTNRVHLNYYADRGDSVTNTVDPDYFLKKEVLEIQQVEFLRKNNFLDLYKSNHLDNFIRNWYLVKLADVPIADVERSKEVLARILALYDKDLGSYLADTSEHVSN